MLSIRMMILAASVSVVGIAGCNGILGIDPAHLEDQDAGMTDAGPRPDVVTTGPCTFDNPNSQFDKGCTFGP